MIQRLLLFMMLAAWTTGGAAQPAKLAIIIDDIGYSGLNGRRAVALPGPITLAVLPHTPHGVRLARDGHQAGKEIMLHIPMSNSQNLPMDNGGLDSAMDYPTFMATLRTALDEIPHIQGANNHMGSQLTQEPRPMGWLMAELAERQLYFVDSRTSAQSRAYEVAQRYGIASRNRDVFLDNERTEAAIESQLEHAIRQARRKGDALAIGHPYPETLAVLERVLPQLTDWNVVLVPASALLNLPLDLPQPDRRGCLAPPQRLWHAPEPAPKLVDIDAVLELGLPE